jgi:hypothetical protein
MIFPFMWPIPKYVAITFGILYILATNIVIYACHKGYGGYINEFLSLKFWIPLSKMALSIYLVSMCHQGAMTMIRTTPHTTVTLGDIVS